MREIVVDTETTGLDPRAGHRIVEIACVELHDYSPTGRWFHAYVDPERRMDADAQRVHGLTDAFLAGKPRFGEPAVLHAMVDFIADAPLVAHNAAFDRAFLEHEFALADHQAIFGRVWIDTLALAQARFPGAPNSLDALCRRFRLSLAEREKHGALIDARLLAQVYLELRGGRERTLDLRIAAGAERGHRRAAPVRGSAAAAANSPHRGRSGRARRLRSDGAVARQPVGAPGTGRVRQPGLSKLAGQAGAITGPPT